MTDISQEEADRFYARFIELWERFRIEWKRFPWRTRVRLWLMLHFGWQ